jgi:hypothetical protein
MDEKEDKVVLAIEEANTKVLEIVNKSMFYGWNKERAKEKVRQLVEETRKNLTDLGASDELILNTTNSILSTFMSAWSITIGTLKEIEKKDKIGVIARTILSMESNTPIEVTDKGLVVDVIDDNVVGVGKGGVRNLRDYMTANETLGAGQRFDDYTTRINEALNSINERLADNTMTLIGSDGRKLSVRNLAEIESRYKMISEDLTRNGINVNDFVIASSHMDASERCSWWQGKIFLVDLDINSRPMGQYKGKQPTQDILGYIDGKPYYSLLQACQNGFLSYNCQHRLIKYYKGIKPPKYDFISVKKKRNLTAIQRNMENNVRRFKRREVLSNSGVILRRKNPYTEKMELFKERDYNTMMSKYWQERYSQFSNANNLPEYRWRLRITQAEREITT